MATRLRWGSVHCFCYLIYLLVRVTIENQCRVLIQGNTHYYWIDPNLNLSKNDYKDANLLACKCLLREWNNITVFCFVTIIWSQITVLWPFFIFLASGFSGLRRSVFYIVQILHWGTRGITEVNGPACSWAVSPEPLLLPDRSSIKAWRRVLSQHLEKTSNPPPQVSCIVCICMLICCKFWFNWILYKVHVWPWKLDGSRSVSLYSLVSL